MSSKSRHTSPGGKYNIQLLDTDDDLHDLVDVTRYQGRQPIFALRGEVTKGQSAAYAIDDQEFSIGKETWIFGEFRIGSVAEVQGTLNLDGCKYARRIIVID